MKTSLLCATLAALAVPAAANAHPAAADMELPQVIVSYADLDLNHTAGADVMIARVRRAAETVCRGDLPAELRRKRTCIRSAIAGAYAQLDAPLVTTRARKAPPHGEFAAR